MEPIRFHHIEELFHKVRAVEPADRAALLDELCGDDVKLRAEVESLLAHSNGTSAGATRRPGDDGPVTSLVERGPVVEGPGARIGPYKILQEIGEGGFGVVYMAEQVTPVQRKVALKIIKLGMDTKQVIARFEAERQALALMDHPNIAKVLDAGATETGRPYFVMELVKGVSLAEYCNRNRLTTTERLELFVQVCRAVQHAHQKGIIHRDLKPSNVLVTLHDTRPVPKVIDFGIAKATSRQLTELTLFTEFRHFIGTPEYMSPDQAEISGLDVDTRTDIYSLGVILYELLTSTTPFDAETLRQASYGEIQRIIQEEEPPKPSTRMQTLMDSGSGQDLARKRQAEPSSLSRQLQGDLDWIVMKAMEKDRTRRYQSASELASDLERFLTDQPVLAGPPSVLYKARKFVRRHRLGVAASIFIAVTLVVGFSIATVGLVQARQEARRSQRIADFLQDLFVSADPEQALTSDVDVAEVLGEARDVFGNDHAMVAAVLGSRALQLQSSGDLEAAESLYHEALDIWRGRVGENNANVAATLSRLGMLHLTKGDDAAAEEALRESLRISGQQVTGTSLAKCETMAQLAGALANRGKFDEAETLLRESIRLRQEQAPDQRLQLALNYHMLSNVLALAGRLDDVIDLAPATIEAWRAAIPTGSSLMGRLSFEYGVIYYELERFSEAEPLLQEARANLADGGEAMTTYRGGAARLLARIYEKRHEPAGAMPFALETLQIARALQEPEDVERAAELITRLAWSIAAEPGRSVGVYASAREAIVETLKDQPDDPGMLNTLGALECRLGEYERALATLATPHGHFAAKYGVGSPTDLAFMAMAHAHLGHEGEAADALAKLREVVRDPRFALEKDAPRLLAEAESLIEHSPPVDRP